MTTRLVLAALLGVLVLGNTSALAGPPPAYFVDESKLPFDALAGTSTTRSWGVHGGAGYRIEVPTTGTATSCSTPTASAAPGSS